MLEFNWKILNQEHFKSRLFGGWCTSLTFNPNDDAACQNSGSDGSMWGWTLSCWTFIVILGLSVHSSRIEGSSLRIIIFRCSTFVTESMLLVTGVCGGFLLLLLFAISALILDHKPILSSNFFFTSISSRSSNYCQKHNLGRNSLALCCPRKFFHFMSKVIFPCIHRHKNPFFINMSDVHHATKNGSFRIDVGLAKFNTFCHFLTPSKMV